MLYVVSAYLSSSFSNVIVINSWHNLMHVGMGKFYY